MKRLTCILLALVMILSLSITAFAADGEVETGTITITNATVGDTYTLYKIFDANASGEDEDAVAYSINPETNQFFSYMFGNDGNSPNDYFVYNPNNRSITRKPASENRDEDIFHYLTEMIRAEGKTWTPATDPIEATSQTVAFTGLTEGYYLIDKGVGTAVTITSNKPDAQVIDKNQAPAANGAFQKWVQEYGTERWVQNSTTSVGETPKFKVEFTATNYDGENQIKYYTVRDTKGNALWVEFNDIKVSVNKLVIDENGEAVKGELLSDSNNGYYHFAGTDAAVNTGDWTGLGDWLNKTDFPAGEEDNADWYLIHRGYDEFEIVIPWLTGQNFTGTSTGFTMTYADDAASKYPSPVIITIEYEAAVEPNATIGVNQDNNLWNTAALTWTSTITTGSNTSSTGLTVYALGLDKYDGADQKPLADAVFKLYSDDTCTNPVYVIPTDIQGVYILDDLNVDTSGKKRESARKLYEEYLAEYLNGALQKNEVTSQVNGKLLILGLAAGDYYLQEVTPPDGYNVLPAPVHVSVGAGNSLFTFYIDQNDKTMVDEHAEDFATSGAVRKDYYVTHTGVANNVGVELPSTGGEGTMMLISIGTMFALVFAVLLITHKKMSVYRD